MIKQSNWSQTNIILCTPPKQIRANEPYELQLEKQIYVRYFSEQHLANNLCIVLKGYARISRTCWPDESIGCPMIEV
ncbi:hypothetical protein ACWH4V_05370 [Bacillus mojavensis]